MKDRLKGFTLVELLVVIAIIGILAAVILTALNDARQQGLNAKVKSEMDSIAKRASIEESGSYTYHTVCGTGGSDQSEVVAGLITSIQTILTPDLVTCNSGATSYAVSVPLAGSHWCIDSTGSKKEIADALEADELVCPES